MPQSPRHLMNRNRDQECLETLARLRSTTTDDIKVRIEYLEIMALRDFERMRLAEKFPQYQDGSFKSNFMIGFHDYMSLVTDGALRRRTVVAILTMVFQQWNGVRIMLLARWSKDSNREIRLMRSFTTLRLSSMAWVSVEQPPPCSPQVSSVSLCS